MLAYMTLINENVFFFSNTIINHNLKIKNNNIKRIVIFFYYTPN